MSRDLLVLALSNTLTAFVLAILVAIAARWLRRPALLHGLWFIVLMRLVAPVIVPVHLIPAAEDGVVAVEAGAMRPANGAVLGSPDAPLMSVSDGIVLLWLLGIAAATGLALIRLLRAASLISRAEPAPEALLRKVESIATRLETRPLPVLYTDRAIPPSLWAVGSKPRIVIPRELAESLTPLQLETLVAHELAHAARRDHWVRWIELVITIVCWWNPITWWVRRQLRRAEERSCDARVVASFVGHSRAYAESLITTLRFLSCATPVHMPATTGMADLSEIQGRLTHIMKPENTRPKGRRLHWSLALLAVATLTMSPILAARGADDLPEVFHEHLTLHLEKAALADVAATIETVTGIPVIVAGDLQVPISASINDVSLVDALNLMAEYNHFHWSYDDDHLTITVLQIDRTELTAAGELDGAPVFSYHPDHFEAPEKIGGPSPEYPEQARQDEIQGIVVLNALIDASGRVRDQRVLRADDPSLAESAMRAVEQWTFDPARKDGIPVAVRYNLTVRFSLE